MNVDVSMSNLRLDTVFTMQAGSCLVKGGQKANPAIYNACLDIAERYLCYYWRDGNEVLHVGSVSDDYRHKKNNLWGRVSNYLQNHRDGATNKNVFDDVNRLLDAHCVEFGVFRFDSCSIGKQTFTYTQCCHAPGISFFIRMIEDVLIGFYRAHQQCKWNR